MIKKAFLIISIFCVSILLSNTSLAQTTEQIENYEVVMDVSESGLVTITENIEYNFGSNQRHGIYRDIKTIFENKDGKKFETPLEILAVTDDLGNKYNYEQSKSNNDLSIKIGSASKYVTGTKHYVIKYTLTGVIEEFSDHDEIFHNVTGTNWNVPINNAEFTIVLRENVPQEFDAVCYAGKQTSATSSCEIVKEGNVVTYITTEELAPYEGLTAGLSFEKGYVTIIPKEEYQAIHPVLKWGLIIASVLWYLLLPIYVIYYYFKNGRDPKPTYTSIPALFEAPTNDGRRLTPAESGTIVDEMADNSDITASIVDLAIRGYLKIDEVTEDNFTGKLLSKKDYKLTKLDKANNTSELLKFERTLLSELFKDSNEIELNKLKKKFYSASTKIKNQVYDQVVDDGFFPHNPDKVRKKWFALGAVAMSTLNVHAGILALALGKVMPRKTKAGVDVKTHVKGMKVFLSSQEDQLEFQEKNWHMFEKLLPYAVALGVTSTWINRFKDLEGNYDPAWYGGKSIMSTSSFSDSMSSFNSSVSSISTTTSSSGYSSGFSGGSSGGGFSGGGGGGSW